MRDNKNCEIRLLDPQHLESVVAIHKIAFPESTLTAAGKGAVLRYYRWLFDGPHEAIAMGAFLDKELAGFMFGGYFRGAMSGFIKKNWWYLCMCVVSHPKLLRLLMNKEYTDTVFKSLKHKVPSNKCSRQSDGFSSFGVLSIAVLPQFKGRGVGTLLMKNAETEAIARGYRAMHLTVHPDNKKAVSFYEKLGWIKVVGDASWQGKMKKLLDLSKKVEQ